MAMQLPPETESRLREAADRAAITVTELLNRTFAPAPPPVPPGTNGAASVAGETEETPEETRVRVQGLLNRWRSEAGMPTPPLTNSKSVAQLFAEWEAEDANLTPEQVQEELLFWEEYQRERGKYPVEM